MIRSTPSRRRVGLARKVSLAAAAAAIAGPALLIGTAGAHVTPQDGEGPSDGYFTTAFKVGHGCDGSPTTKVAIKMAEGVTSVAPQPVPGWTLTTTTRQVDPPIELHGTQITETTDEVIWEGGPLPDHELQMFWISMKLPAGEAGTALEFPVVQTCETGESAWIEPTVEGEEEPEKPAPIITLTAPDGGHGAEATTTTVADDGDASGEEASADSSDDSGSGNGLGIAGIVLGALGLLTGGAALARSSKK